MEKKMEEKEAEFGALLQTPPYQTDAIIDALSNAPANKMDEWTTAAIEAFAEVKDFFSALKIVDARTSWMEKKNGIAIRDALKRATSDRLILSFIDSVGFGTRQLKESVGRLKRLLQFSRIPCQVLNVSWGLGEVRKIDYFYRRVTVDFRNRKGHQLTFDAACETLVPAPENHILVQNMADPKKVETMIAERPGDFVKEVLKSYGDMPITRLEDIVVQNGFVKSTGWKEFWEKARTDLHKDKTVEIPTRRTEPIHLKKSVENYSDSWFTALAGMRDPKSILSSVKEFQNRKTGKAEAENADTIRTISERLAFALKGARGVDDALYARIAFCLDAMKLNPELVTKARNYLWDNKRFIEAAKSLPASDTGTLVKFLTDDNREERKRPLFSLLPQMCFSLLSETLKFFGNDADCEDAVAKLLKDPKAPPTLITYILGRHTDFYPEPGSKGEGWTKLPPMVVLLTHAIALGEGKQSGETLRMQNVIRRLFADRKWLEGIFKKLNESDQALFFERFQASIAWDPSTHHMIVVRMTETVPALKSRRVMKTQAKQEERVTSRRSYAERQAAYAKLINVTIPANTKRIEEAKSYGDLSENAEYQYAKDEQRALLQKQTEMQQSLKDVKAVDFAGVEADVVKPGVSVVIKTADGAEKTYTVLGEWDNDLERNIISNRTKLAQNMLGKKAGDTFDLPDADGNVSTATISAVLELSNELHTWINEAVEG